MLRFHDHGHWGRQDRPILGGPLARRVRSLVVTELLKYKTVSEVSCASRNRSDKEIGEFKPAYQGHVVLGKYVCRVGREFVVNPYIKQRIGRRAIEPSLNIFFCSFSSRDFLCRSPTYSRKLIDLL